MDYLHVQADNPWYNYFLNHLSPMIECNLLTNIYITIKVLIIHYMVRGPKVKITIRLDSHLKCFTSRLQVKIVHCEGTEIEF